jgi:hypothetical protein
MDPYGFICLSVAGAIVVGKYYFAVDLLEKKCGTIPKKRE